MSGIAWLVLCFTAVTAAPSNPQRIMGGSVTTIDQYPSIASLLRSYNLVIYNQACVGTILNDRAILTAAHCTFGDAANRWRIRVGSTWANGGGTVYYTAHIVNHPSYNAQLQNNDISVLRSTSTIVHNDLVRPAAIAGSLYTVSANEPVWAAGWGTTYYGGLKSDQLRDVELRVVDHTICRNNYASQRIAITENMMCAGWPIGGRDQCEYDSGGPLYHRGVVVGIYSFGISCGIAQFPSVNTLVSRYPHWINSVA